MCSLFTISFQYQFSIVIRKLDLYVIMAETNEMIGDNSTGGRCVAWGYINTKTNVVNWRYFQLDRPAEMDAVRSSV